MSHVLPMFNTFCLNQSVPNCDSSHCSFCKDRGGKVDQSGRCNGIASKTDLTVAQLVQRIGLGSKSRGFESCPEHKKNFVRVFLSQNVVLTPRCRCAPPPCVYARIIRAYARQRSCSPCHSSVDYGNTKKRLASMH